MCYESYSCTKSNGVIEFGFTFKVDLEDDGTIGVFDGGDGSELEDTEVLMRGE